MEAAIGAGVGMYLPYVTLRITKFLTWRARAPFRPVVFRIDAAEEAEDVVLSESGMSCAQWWCH